MFRAFLRIKFTFPHSMKFPISVSQLKGTRMNRSDCNYMTWRGMDWKTKKWIGKIYLCIVDSISAKVAFADPNQILLSKSTEKLF